MSIGSPTEWLKGFVTVDQRLLQRISFVWAKCSASLPAQPEEDLITINLVDVLAKDAVVRRICYWIEYQFEPFGTAPDGTKFSKGKIDIAVFLDWERTKYVAYECKRLNVSYNGVRSSLATAYVKEGMMRFMTEQYAEGLPIGCMLGYVIDGDLAFIKVQIANAVNASKSDLGLLSGPTDMASVQVFPRFLTEHQRPVGGKPIQIRHALLPFVS